MRSKPAASLQDPKKQRRTYFLVIVAIAFLFYGNSIGNGYALDDNYVTATGPQNPNPRVQKGFAGIAEIFSSHYFESEKQNFEYRPLVLTTFAIEYQFFGSNPHVSHFINIMLYALTGIVLLLVLTQLFAGFHALFPLFITVFFMAHPVHSEVVNNLKCRDELLSFLFGMLSLRAFLLHAKEGAFKHIAYGVIFLVVALLSKRTAILFAGLIPATLFLFTNEKKQKIVLFALLLAGLYFVFEFVEQHLLSAERENRQYAFIENPLFHDKDLSHRIPTAFYALGYYIRLLIFPHPLSCYYGFKTIPVADWTSLFAWASILFHLFIGIYAVLSVRKKPILAYAIFIYLLGISPFTNLTRPIVGVIGERFIYFSSLGFCIALGYLFFAAFVREGNKMPDWKQWKPGIKIMGILVLGLFFLKSVSRNSDWKDELTLFRADLKTNPNSCNLNYIAGNALSKRIKTARNDAERSALIREATAYYQRAVELMEEGKDLYPGDYVTLNNLGTIYVDVLKRPDLGQPLFKQVMSIKQDNLDARFNYAYCFEQRNLLDSAVVAYRLMVNGRVDYPAAYNRLRDLHYRRKEFPAAVEVDSLALEVYPRQTKFYINLGNSYMLAGDTLKGMRYFEKAALLEPQNGTLRKHISDVFRLIGDTAKAAKYAHMAL